MDEGDHANISDYLDRYFDLNSKLSQFKSRKSEYATRDDAVKSSYIKLDKLQDSLEKLTTKKEWITAE